MVSVLDRDGGLRAHDDRTLEPLAQRLVGLGHEDLNLVVVVAQREHLGTRVHAHAVGIAPQLVDHDLHCAPRPQAFFTNFWAMNRMCSRSYSSAMSGCASRRCANETSTISSSLGAARRVPHGQKSTHSYWRSAGVSCVVMLRTSVGR